MKSLAIVALMAVPRPALELLADQFHGWRKLLRACLVALLWVAALGVSGLLYLILIHGGRY